jgi:hypothetical protein
MFRDFVRIGVICTSIALSACNSAPAASAFADRIDFSTARCKQVTVEMLWANPWPYAEKRICVSAYLGHMVLYGEDSVDLYDTKQEAERRDSQHYITVSVPLTMKSQEEIARHSDQKLDAVGIFRFDSRCWPQKGEETSRFQCFPSRPMNLIDPSIALSR